MAFWGAVIRRNETYTIHQANTDVPRRLRITRATIESKNSSPTSRTMVFCRIGNKEPIMIAALTFASNASLNLDFELEELEDINFFVKGPHDVHMAGYYKQKYVGMTFISPNGIPCMSGNAHLEVVEGVRKNLSRTEDNDKAFHFVELTKKVDTKNFPKGECKDCCEGRVDNTDLESLPKDGTVAENADSVGGLVLTKDLNNKQPCNSSLDLLANLGKEECDLFEDNLEHVEDVADSEDETKTRSNIFSGQQLLSGIIRGISTKKNFSKTVDAQYGNNSACGVEVSDAINKPDEKSVLALPSPSGDLNKDRIENRKRKNSEAPFQLPSVVKRIGSSSGRQRSLLATPVSIFSDHSSESSENSDTSTKTPSDDSSSSSDSEEERVDGTESARGADFERSKKDPKTLHTQRMDMNMILRSSRIFKMAKLSAVQSQLQDTESQPVDLVPDSQLNR